MTITFQLRPSIRPSEVANAAAWFFPGDSVADLMDEMVRAGMATLETRLYAIPRSARDPSLGGVLVLTPKANSETKARSRAATASPERDRSAPVARPVGVRRGVACRLMGDRLYLPIDADLFPPATDEEIRVNCPWPVAFFHPALGLSGFEESAARRIDDLIELPDERVEMWNGARQGVEPWPELRGIIWAEPPTLSELFGGAENEIGQARSENLPPTSMEPGGGALADSGRNLRQWLAKGMLAAIDRVPRVGSERTWLNELADWARAQLTKVTEQLDQLRNKELHRLFHLLKTDPDQGLRHAISMGQFPHRGTTPPGTRLGNRRPDFSANRLGGGPADFWNVSEDWQEILRRKYRELADREMRLGRHRRAAYIYAELLGDLVSAAQVLKQGRHFREAALLYEEHLGQALEAAQCLSAGGLWSEAIARFEKLGRWLDAAELYEKLGQRADAEVLIRRVVQERLAADDPLAAARLLEERLRDADEALAVLFDAWPSSRQAGSCLTTALQMLGRLGRHEAALERLNLLRNGGVPDAIATTLVTGLVNAVRDYPAREFRDQASDYSRILIARQLSRQELGPGQGAMFVDLLARLAPGDRLVTRDGQRHLESLRRPASTGRGRPAPASGRQPAIVRRIELPRQIEWFHLTAGHGYFFAAGLTAKHLTLVRGSWDGPFQSLSWLCPPKLARSGLVVEHLPRSHLLVVAVPGTPPFPNKTFPATDDFFNRSCVAGALGVETLPLSCNDETRWSIHVAVGRAVVSCRGHEDVLLSTVDITRELLEGTTRTDTARVFLTALASGAAVALGDRLVLLQSGREPETIALPGQATGLVRTLPHTRQGVVVPLDHGAVMWWFGGTELRELDRDIAAPVGAFLPGGPLVLLSAAERRLLLLETDHRGVTQVTVVPLAGTEPVGVSAAGTTGQFAVLDRSGMMTIHSVTAR